MCWFCLDLRGYCVFVFKGLFASTVFVEWLLGFISVSLFSAHERFYFLRCTTFVLKLHTSRKSFLWDGNVTTRKVSLLGL